MDNSLCFTCVSQGMTFIGQLGQAKELRSFTLPCPGLPPLLLLLQFPHQMQGSSA